VQGDVAKIADLDRLFKQIEKLDIVFANAGAAEYAPFGQVNEAQFDRLFASNVKGTLFSVQKALPLMPDGGAIVLTGSVV
jgi:NAD(P)-dependent dehydrogenase (short-subunit alcohol dehydrogenase family)